MLQKALIVGLGSIARRHIRNLKAICPGISIGVWRQHSREGDLGDVTPLVEKVFFEPQEVLTWKPNLAVLANPNNLHMENGLMLAEQGVHLLIEKPLSHSLEQVDALLECCRERSLVLMVGYNFRFYEPFQKIRALLVEGKLGRLISLRAEAGQYLPDWRADRNYRTGVTARSELGGGVVLTLSHEIDYLQWFGGKVASVMAHMGKLSDLDVDVEDTVEIILQFASGAVGNLHLDMVDRAKTRRCRLLGTEGTLAWDMDRHHVGFFSGREQKWEDLYLEPNLDVNAMYVEELRHFIECVHEKKQPVVSGHDGKCVLEIALAVKQSASSRREVCL